MRNRSWVYMSLNEGKSAVSFCLQVAAWVSDMFCNFFFEWKITKLLITEQLLNLEKNKHTFGILRILGFFLMHVWLYLKTIKFYLIKLATDFHWKPSYLLGKRATLPWPNLNCHIHVTYLLSLTLLTPFEYLGFFPLWKQPMFIKRKIFKVCPGLGANPGSF